MKISGFTIAKNTSKLYYPIKQSILSILPIVDEFVVALGDCDLDDKTESEILSINSEKIKIVRTIWDSEKYSSGTEAARQTDIAKSHCTGDWLFYIQADEVIHEKDLPAIQKACSDYLNNSEIEGFIFHYLHFWGNYNHHQIAHGWYKNEIRIIRNLPEIHSWRDAQSFRKIPNFDGINYRQTENTFKLRVKKIPANVFHYGWVRPPRLMQSKNKIFNALYIGKKKVTQIYEKKPLTYDYGPLGRARIFEGTHPKVMEEWILKFDWSEDLNYTKKDMNQNREKHKHDRIRNKILTFFEQNFLNGEEIGGFKNYIELK
jgi:hypothetical protein